MPLLVQQAPANRRYASRYQPSSFLRAPVMVRFEFQGVSRLKLALQPGLSAHQPSHLSPLGFPSKFYEDVIDTPPASSAPAAPVISTFAPIESDGSSPIRALDPEIETQTKDAAGSKTSRNTAVTACSRLSLTEGDGAASAGRVPICDRTESLWTSDPEVR